MGQLYTPARAAGGRLPLRSVAKTPERSLAEATSPGFRHLPDE